MTLRRSNERDPSTPPESSPHDQEPDALEPDALEPDEPGRPWRDHRWLAAAAGVIGGVAALIAAITAIFVPLLTRSSDDGPGPGPAPTTPSSPTTAPNPSPQPASLVVPTTRDQGDLAVCAPNSCEFLAASVERYDSSDAVLRDASELDVAELTKVAQSLQPSWAEYLRRKEPSRVVDAGGYSFEVVLSGRSSARVIVTNVRVRLLSREPVPSGAHLTDEPECGAPEEPIKLRVFLDQEPVTPLLYDPSTETYAALDQDWAVSVTQDDVETLVIDTFAYQSLVSFVIELDYSVNGQRGIMRIDQEGAPFTLTGVNQRTPRYNVFQSGAEGYIQRRADLDGTLNECLTWPAPVTVAASG